MPVSHQISQSGKYVAPAIYVAVGLSGTPQHMAGVAPHTDIIGKQNRSEIELDPVKAYRRGRVFDAMLRSATPPIQRGVTRGTHEYYNRLDDERQMQMARALNKG